MSVRHDAVSERRLLREPPVLAPGAHVALVSPSGPLDGAHELQRAVATAESLGWTVQIGTHALTRTGYFAGDDVQRGDDLVAALLDPGVDGIWCLRGGYGAARLLPRVQPVLAEVPPKALLGYSDITALHLAWQQAGVVSFHGPTARSPLSAFSRASLVDIVQQHGSPQWHAPTAQCVRGGVASGRLAGGNLALLASLCGTPWAPTFHDAIVVLEDIGEATYRIDRMLTQLVLAGAFEGCRGVVFGQFTDCPDSTRDDPRTLLSLAEELANVLAVPTLLGVPVGHVEDQWTLPLGAHAALDADARTLAVNRVPAAVASHL
jgi:muramoyltetrapeptide carboxypeptidase